MAKFQGNHIGSFNGVDSPNPKPLSVLRVNLRVSKGDNEEHGQTEQGFIRNAKIDPSEIARGL